MSCQSGDFCGRGIAYTGEGNTWAGSPVGLGGGVEIVIVVIRVVDDLEDVSLVNGFSTIEAKRKHVLIFLMLDVVQETLLAGAVPTAGYGGLEHGPFGADWAFVVGFSLYLLQNVGSIFIRDVLLPGVRGEAFDQLLEVHVIG